jgi:hypothetical protein
LLFIDALSQKIGFSIDTIYRPALLFHPPPKSIDDDSGTLYFYDLLPDGSFYKPKGFFEFLDCSHY